MAQLRAAAQRAGNGRGIGADFSLHRLAHSQQRFAPRHEAYSVGRLCVFRVPQQACKLTLASRFRLVARSGPHEEAFSLGRGGKNGSLHLHLRPSEPGGNHRDRREDHSLLDSLPRAVTGKFHVQSGAGDVATQTVTSAYLR